MKWLNNCDFCHFDEYYKYFDTSVSLVDHEWANDIRDNIFLYGHTMHGKLFRSELVSETYKRIGEIIIQNHIVYFEDMLFISVAFLLAERYGKIPVYAYNYKENSNSLQKIHQQFKELSDLAMVSNTFVNIFNGSTLDSARNAVFGLLTSSIRYGEG